MGKHEHGRALIVTVGTGDLSQIEDTLLIPLRKSLEQGEWERVILLPSKITEAHAHALLDTCASLPIEIHPLPEAEMENNVDACFAHFDDLIGELRSEGFDARNLVADFTRGTKAMSAALVLAVVRHDVPTLRYIQGERDVCGMVKPGAEIVSEVLTTLATGKKLIELSYRFFLSGNFAAAWDVLPDPTACRDACWPGDLIAFLGFVRPMAMFYACWDRLDYKAACKVEHLPPPRASEWDRLTPTHEMKAWVERLAQPLPKESDKKACRMKASHLRLLAADLLANGERRIRHGQFEDAVVRAYRVLELVGQARLFDVGLDSARLPADDEAILNLKAKLEKDKATDRFGVNRDGTLNAGRLLVARLLKAKGDALARGLIDAGDTPLLKNRNVSVLIHGFEAAGPAERGPLKDLYGRLEEILVSDGSEETRRNLAIARSMDFEAA